MRCEQLPAISTFAVEFSGATAENNAGNEMLYALSLNLGNDSFLHMATMGKALRPAGTYESKAGGIQRGRELAMCFYLGREIGRAHV